MVVVPRREDYQWALPMTVRWSDMDARRHINHARYMTYAESARLAYFEPLLGEADHRRKVGSGLIMANISCAFLQQLHYPAEIDVGTRVVHIGRSSMSLEQTIFHGELGIAHLHAVMVWFDYVAQKAISVPEAARAFILGREGGTLAGASGT